MDNSQVGKFDIPNTPTGTYTIGQSNIKPVAYGGHADSIQPYHGSTSVVSQPHNTGYDSYGRKIFTNVNSQSVSGDSSHANSFSSGAINSGIYNPGFTSNAGSLDQSGSKTKPIGNSFQLGKIDLSNINSQSTVNNDGYSSQDSIIQTNKKAHDSYGTGHMYQSGTLNSSGSKSQSTGFSSVRDESHTGQISSINKPQDQIYNHGFESGDSKLHTGTHYGPSGLSGVSDSFDGKSFYKGSSQTNDEFGSFDTETGINTSGTGSVSYNKGFGSFDNAHLDHGSNPSSYSGSYGSSIGASNSYNSGTDLSSDTESYLKGIEHIINSGTTNKGLSQNSQNQYYPQRNKSPMFSSDISNAFHLANTGSSFYAGGSNLANTEAGVYTGKSNLANSETYPASSGLGSYNEGSYLANTGNSFYGIGSNAASTGSSSYNGDSHSSNTNGGRNSYSSNDILF